jgi:hypothetical protein
MLTTARPVSGSTLWALARTAAKARAIKKNTFGKEGARVGCCFMGAWGVHNQYVKQNYRLVAIDATAIFHQWPRCAARHRWLAVAARASCVKALPITAQASVGSVAAWVNTAQALLDNVHALVTNAETLVDTAQTLLANVDAWVDMAQALLDTVQALVNNAETLVDTA